MDLTLLVLPIVEGLMLGLIGGVVLRHGLGWIAADLLVAGLASMVFNAIYSQALWQTGTEELIVAAAHENSWLLTLRILSAVAISTLGAFFGVGLVSLARKGWRGRTD